MNFGRLHLMYKARAAMIAKFPSRYPKAEHDRMGTEENKALASGDVAVWRLHYEARLAKTRIEDAKRKAAEAVALKGTEEVKAHLTTFGESK